MVLNGIITLSKSEIAYAQQVQASCSLMLFGDFSLLQVILMEKLVEDLNENAVSMAQQELEKSAPSFVVTPQVRLCPRSSSIDNLFD